MDKTIPGRIKPIKDLVFRRDSFFVAYSNFEHGFHLIPTETGQPPDKLSTEIATNIAYWHLVKYRPDDFKVLGSYGPKDGVCPKIHDEITCKRSRSLSLRNLLFSLPAPLLGHTCFVQSGNC